MVLVSDKVDLALFAWDLSARTALPGSENLKSDGFVLETVTILCGYMPFGFGNPCGSWHETVNVVSSFCPWV